MTTTMQRERVEALIINTPNWSTDKNYQAIKSFCIDELLVYGIDPDKYTQISLPDGGQSGLTKDRVLADYLFDNKFNWTRSEELRALLLIQIYNYIWGLKIVKAAILRPRTAYGLQAQLKYPEGIYDLETSEIVFNSASRFIAHLTYMLTLTLRDDLTKIELDRVKAQVKEFLQSRARGGLNKAEVEAKIIVRERARHFKTINPRLTKPDLIEKITAEMLQDKDQYKLMREGPSFDTLSKWLVKLDID
jgi:hypothetical protein